MKYSYPVLSDKDFGWFRVGGPGLANCLIIAARAYIDAKKNNNQYVDPTWFKFSLGPWLRHERDKRFYNKLFNHVGISGLRKSLVLCRISLDSNVANKFDDLGDYFVSLYKDYDLVMELLNEMVIPETISVVNDEELQDCVALHVRLGDYLPHLRVNIKWYDGIIKNILGYNPEQKFVIFSDGTVEELSLLLENQNTQRVFYGNAFADMWAISKCKLLIASDSTFSAWGAFIGRVPLIFSKRHFPAVFSGDILEFVLGDECEIPAEITQLIR